MSDKGYTIKSSGTNSQVSIRPPGFRSIEKGSLTPYPTGQPLLLAGLWQQLQLVPLLQHVGFRQACHARHCLRLTASRDGSYYYSNPNGSTYYNNGSGGSTYTGPSGAKYSSGYGSSSSSGNSGSSGSK
jgi:hypothetical protein